LPSTTSAIESDRVGKSRARRGRAERGHAGNRLCLQEESRAGTGIPWPRGGAARRQRAQTDGAPDAMEQGISGPPDAVELGRRLRRGSLVVALGSPDRWKKSVIEMDGGACGRTGRVRASAKERGAGREKKIGSHICWPNRCR